MLKIKAPATTSNLAVGFDALGMALDIYNEFEFSLSDHFELIGFKEKFQNDNIVQIAYESFCKANGLNDYVKVCIKLVKEDIPIARGLGSSATCIISGVLAANHFNKLNKSLLECAAYASELEGHPDNVFALVFGGLVSALKTETGYLFDSFEVSNNLHFGLLIPTVTGVTETLREALPEKVSMIDAVFHLSRMIHLPKALAEGNLQKLKVLLQDKIHESYRSSHIPQFELIKKTAFENGIIACISGSGPTMFFISDKDNLDVLKKLENNSNFHIVNVSEGVKSEVSK